MRHVWFTLVESDKKAKLMRFDIFSLLLEVKFVCNCFYKIIRVVELIVWEIACLDFLEAYWFDRNECLSDSSSFYNVW